MRAVSLPVLLALISQSAFSQLRAPSATLRMEGDEPSAAYARAIAPYIAKARKTYPAAKKRFQAGLPRGYMFAVAIRLQGIDHARKEIQEAQVLVDVYSIKKGTIYGRINSPISMAGHKQGDLISFPESEIIDWVIQHPDGSEEGNVVGKFADHYKPKSV